MSPVVGKELLYLSQDDVSACGVDAASMNACIEKVFLDEANGEAWTQPKLAIFRPDGASFRAKGGVSARPSYGALKWFGYFPDNAGRGLPDFAPLIILSEGETGLPVSIMDGVWISAARTGSMTAVAAKHMARANSTRVGFVACGTQSRSNLDALLEVFPIDRVTAYSRSLSSAERFAEEATAKGVDAVAVLDSRDAVSGQDIVVTSVPHASSEAQFLDAGDVSPGTFISMVDLGYGWRRVTLEELDRVFTDNVEQSGPSGSEQLNYSGTYTGSLADVVSGGVTGRISDEEKTALVFAGVGHADTAAAIAVYQAACAKGIGKLLPL